MSDIAFPGLSKIEDIFKALVWDNLVRVALAALFSAVPWLNIPIVRQVISYLLEKFADKLFSIMRLAVDMEAIILVNEAHRKAYQTESLKLKIIAHDKGIDSDEFKKERENAKESLAKFVRFGATT